MWREQRRNSKKGVMRAAKWWGIQGRQISPGNVMLDEAWTEVEGGDEKAK